MKVNTYSMVPVKTKFVLLENTYARLKKFNNITTIISIIKSSYEPIHKEFSFNLNNSGLIR